MSGIFSAGVVPPPPPTVIIAGVSFSAAGRLPYTALLYGGLLLTQYARIDAFSFSAAGRLPYTALLYGGLLLTQYARIDAFSGATSTPRTPNATILT